MTAGARPKPGRPLPETPAECTHCGACCLSPDSRYIRVFEVDWARMDASARRLTNHIDGHRYMRVADGHCSALEANSATGTFRCSIHPSRPDVCRAMRQGSNECRRQARDKGPRALLLLRRDQATCKP